MNTVASLEHAGRAAGFREVRVSAAWEDNGWTFCLDVDSFSLVNIEEPWVGWQVSAWSGSYPHAIDTFMGEFEEPLAVVLRYAKWLQDREDFYQERDEKLWRDLGEEPDYRFTGGLQMRMEQR